MQKLLGGLGLTLALAAAAGTAQAQDSVVLQLKWVTQGQFAGYYVAQEKGFYEEAGLDVTINPGGPDIAPPQVIAGGGADVIIDWMPSALASREKGVRARQHRPALQELRHDADLPRRHRHHDAGGFPAARRSASGSSATNIRSSPGCRSSASRPRAATTA